MSDSSKGLSESSSFSMMFLLYVVWGFSFLVIKKGLEQSPPLFFATARALAAGLVFLPIAWKVGEKRAFPGWRESIILGLTNVTGFLGLQSLGMVSVSGGTAALLIYSQPLLVGVLARFWLKELLAPIQKTALLIGFVGIAIVYYSTATQMPPLRVLLLLGSALSWAFGSVYFKRSVGRDALLWSVSLQNIIGALPLAVAALSFEQLPSLSWGLASAILYTGICASGVGWMILFTILGRRTATVASQYTFLVPVFGMAFGLWLQGEVYNGSLLVGGAVVLLSIYLMNKARGEDIGSYDSETEEERTKWRETEPM